MHTKFQKLSDTQLEVVIDVEESELTSLKNHVLSHFEKNVKVAGFRPGKAPKDLIEKNIDPTTLQAEFLDEALNNYLSKAVEQEKIRVIGQP